MGRSNIFYDKYARTKRRLFLLILIMTFVSLGAGLGILKLSSVKTVGLGLETVYHDRVKPLKQLKALSDIYAITIVDTSTKVLQDSLSWQEGRRCLKEATGKIPGLWNEYLKTYLTDEERQAAEGLQLLFQATDEALLKLEGVFVEEDRRALADFAKADLYQTIEPVTRKIDELFHMQVRIVKEINEKEKTRYQFALTIGMASIAISVILFFIVVLQWRRCRSLLDSL